MYTVQALWNDYTGPGGGYPTVISLSQSKENRFKPPPEVIGSNWEDLLK
jgi:hypothetical protein